MKEETALCNTYLKDRWRQLDLTITAPRKPIRAVRRCTRSKEQSSERTEGALYHARHDTTVRNRAARDLAAGGLSRVRTGVVELAERKLRRMRSAR